MCGALIHDTCTFNGTGYERTAILARFILSHIATRSVYVGFGTICDILVSDELGAVRAVNNDCVIYRLEELKETMRND
jgi:hypothetical protein